MTSAEADMKAERLDFSQLDGQNPVFLRYLYDFDQVKNWYPAGPPDPGLIRVCARRVLSSGRSYPRNLLAEQLEHFNRLVGAGEPAMRNIAKLREAGTVAIVTGHKAGLFGGSASAVYKAITAVRCAALLSEEGIPAIPVFWLATDDEDFEEFASTVFLDEGGQLLRVRHVAPPAEKRMAGTALLDDVLRVLYEVQEKAVRGPFKGLVMEGLREAYHPDRTFGQAFAAYMARLFAEQGLVLHDARLPGLRPFLQEFFAKVENDWQDIVPILRERVNELSGAGFFSPITMNDVALFEGRLRFNVGSRNTGDSEKKGDGSKTDDEHRVHPAEKRSDFVALNILLRPILQAHLFPTAVHVGDPAEVASFAVLSALGALWDVELAILPHASVTLVDAKAQRLLRRYRLSLRDVIGASADQTRNRLIRDSKEEDIVRRFESWETGLKAELSAIKGKIDAVDPTFSVPLAVSETKMLYQVEKVRERFVKNSAERRSTLERQVAFLHNSLFPEQKPQERLLNFNHFRILCGPILERRLLESVEPFCRKHQVFYVPSE